MSRVPLQFKISSLIDHTPSVRELKLRSEKPFQFKAGQFVMLHVPDGENKPALRAYSIASSDEMTEGFDLLFKYVEGGKASEFVWKLEGHETLNFTGPFGKVFFQEPAPAQVIFMNTGTGVSQHLCYLLSKASKYPNTKYHMLFGVRSQKDIYAEDQLKKLQESLPHFQYEYVLSRPEPGWNGKVGYVQNFLNTFDYKNQLTHFYLCGNGGMIKETKKQLLEVDALDPKQVWTEAFD